MRHGAILANGRGMGGNQAASAKEPARGQACRRPAGNFRHSARVEGRLPLVRLSGRRRAIDDDLQPVQPLVAPWLLARAAGCTGGCRCGDKAHRYRQHLHQGAAGGVRCKGGRAAQAIGRSRSGWTTKIHALTDVIGRPYALMPTPGNVSDMRAAPVLLEHVGRMSTCSAARGMMPVACGAWLATSAPRLSSLVAATASAPSGTTSNAAPAATSSRTPSAA